MVSISSASLPRHSGHVFLFGCLFLLTLSGCSGCYCKELMREAATCWDGEGLIPVECILASLEADDACSDFSSMFGGVVVGGTPITCTRVGTPLLCQGCPAFHENGGFNYQMTDPFGHPNAPRGWSGDWVRVVEETDTIEPCGQWMLSFIATTATAASEGTSSTTLQIIDLSDVDLDGPQRAVANVLVNRMPVEDRRFDLVVAAHDDPNRAPLDEVQATLLADDDPDTWEYLSAELPLPEDFISLPERFVLVFLNADEDVDNDLVMPEFNGSYADGLSVQIGPAEPPPPPLDTDLQVLVTSSRPVWLPGQEVTYAIQVAQAFPTSLSDLRLRHRVPEGLTYISHSAFQGTYDPASGIWTFDMDNTLNFFNITARADTAGVYPITAELLVADQDTTNNTATLDLRVEPQYFLQLTAQATPNPVTAGNEVLIDLLVGNAGGSVAEGVEVTFQVPDGLTYVSDSGEGAYTPATGVWTIGTLPVGPFATLRITAEATAVGTHQSTARITAGLDYDQDPDNNEAVVSVTVDPASAAQE